MKSNQGGQNGPTTLTDEQKKLLATLMDMSHLISSGPLSQTQDQAEMYNHLMQALNEGDGDNL